MTQKQAEKRNENGARLTEQPDPEVLPQAKRRTFVFDKLAHAHFFTYSCTLFWCFRKGTRDSPS